MIKEGNYTLTINDSTFGFMDSGISSNTYIVLKAWTPFASNIEVVVSNLDSGTRNWRYQLVDRTTNSVKTSGTYTIYYLYCKRS